MVYLILICFAVPLLLLMPLLDRRSRLLVGFMLLGMLVAVSSYEINSTAQFLLGMSGREISVKVAPVVEELLKALPVLFYAALVCDDRRQLLPLGMSVGIGFALLENAYLLITYAEQVTLGCVAAEGLDYVALGVQTGKMAAKVLKGEAEAADIPYETIEESALYVNTDACEALGVTIPEDLMARATDMADAE